MANAWDNDQQPATFIGLVTLPESAATCNLPKIFIACNEYVSKGLMIVLNAPLLERLILPYIR